MKIKKNWLYRRLRKKHMAEKMPEAYRPSGQKFSRHGRVFQLKLLMLFLNRGCKKGFKFTLATEIESAKAFDDVLFKYQDENGEVKYRFVQAKHKLEEVGTLINYRDLLGITKEDKKGNFHLLKYLDSFLEIKKSGRPGGTFDNLKVHDLMIYTNTGIDFNELKSKSITLQKLTDKDDILDDEPIGGKTPERYRFAEIPDDEKEIFYCNDDTTHQMAKDLAKRVCHDRPIDLNNSNFEIFHKALVMENIIDVTTKKLHENFIQLNGLSENAKEFRRTFLMEGMKQSKKTTSDDFFEQMKSKKLNLSKEFGESEEQLEEKLPTDRVNNDIINEYLKLLTFAINQPNSEQLDGIINKEISEELKIHDSGLITDAFYRYMWEWMTESKGRFLSNEDLQQFYDKAKKRMKKLSITGVTSHNPEKNLNSEEFFENISAMKMHLNCTEPIINIIAPKSTTLAFMKVVQVLENLYRDSFSATDAKLLLSNEEKYLTAFDYEEEPFTLVVEWSTICNDKEEEVNKLLKNILCKIKPEHNHKLVVISPSVKLDENWNSGSDRVLTIKNDITEFTEFRDLTGNAQSRILSKIVTLQDRKYTVKELLNENTNCITEKMVDAIINEEELVISKRVADLESIDNNYIERKFQKCLTYYTMECLIAESEKGVFAIIGTTKNELLQVMPNLKVCDFGDRDFVNKLSKIIVVQNQDQYMQLLPHFQPHTNIYLLQKVGDRFNILALPNEQALKHQCSEDKLLLEKSKIIAVAAEQGTGKSTVFKQLVTSLINNSSYWVLLINLKNFVDILKETELSRPDNIIRFIIKSQALKQRWQKDLLRGRILACGKIVLFFDGVDDCQQHEGKILSMLKYLITTKIERIYVSSQMDFVKKLETETELNLQTYVMLPFSIQDYATLLKKIWKRNLHLGNDINVENRLGLYVESLVTSFAKSTSLLTNIFLQIPLHAEMIANVYQEQLKEHLKCDNPKMHLDIELMVAPAQLPPFIPVGKWRCNTGFDLLELYREFIRNKMELSLRGIMKLEDDASIYIFEEVISPRILEMHENLALSMLFSEKDQIIFKAKKELPNVALKNAGLIKQFGDKCVFIHPNFAYYFAAQRIYKLLIKYNRASEKYKHLSETLALILFRESSTLIRKFLDIMLAHDSKIHLAGLNGNVDDFKEIVSRGPTEINSRDALGRAPLHYVCMTNAVNVFNYIIAEHLSCVSVLDAFQFSPIWYASLYGSYNILEILFKAGSNVKEFDISLKKLARIFNNQSDPNADILADCISNFADDKQKALIVNSINYKRLFMDSMKKSDYVHCTTFFKFATKKQQQEMFIQNDYEIIKESINRNPIQLWIFLNTIIDDEMKDNICQLEEFKTKFRSLLKSDLNQLWFLVKMANRKQLQNLWGKNGYCRYFQQCANSMRSDMMYELLQLFIGENLFDYLRPNTYLDYFDALLSEKQFYWAGKLFECTNREQSKKLLKLDLWLWELNNALEKNDCNSFNCLLNCVKNTSMRQQMLKHVRHLKEFKMAVSECNLEKLILLSLCNDDECLELTDTMKEEDYCRLFLNKLDNVQSLLLLAHYANFNERQEIFSLAQCPSYVQETVENREFIGINHFDKHDEKLLKALHPNAIIQEISEKKWSIWGRLVYILCKHIKPNPPVEIMIKFNIKFVNKNPEIAK